jgi:hypothetical protein
MSLQAAGMTLQREVIDQLQRLAEDAGSSPNFR